MLAPIFPALQKLSCVSAPSSATQLERNPCRIHPNLTPMLIRSEYDIQF